jgi:hypothetical protein
MNINKNIIDQRLVKIISDYPDWFMDKDVAQNEDKKRTKAFTMLGMAAYLDIELEKTLDMLTDAGNDVGVDGVYIGNVTDTDFQVILFQSKYVKKLETDSNFPENAIIKVIYALGLIFDRQASITVNEKLKTKIAEIHDLAYNSALIPQIKCVMLSNGIRWNDLAQQKIDAYKKENPYAVFDFFNHDDILRQVQQYKSIKTDLKLAGKAYTENLPNFKRVLIGKISVKEIADLFNKHKDDLLEKNIRKFLGIHKNRINQNVRATLLGEQRENFYLYNNGITMICSKFRENGFATDWIVKVDDLQIINGGQTCQTIHQTLTENSTIDYAQVFVMIRLYEIDMDEQQLITDITLSTNSQTPVDLRDLRANDVIQRNLEMALLDLGYTYKRKKDNLFHQPDSIASSAAAEAVFTIWRECPHIAKYKQEELFGKFYDKIFAVLNASQLVIAILVFRFCDNQRRKENLIQKYPHLPYSNYFMAMLVGKILLKKKNILLQDLNHKNLQEIKSLWEQKKEIIFEEANQVLETTLAEVYPNGYARMELRKLAAFFRRNESVQEVLEKI